MCRCLASGANGHDLELRHPFPLQQQAPLDQFYTGGILASAKMAAAAGLEPIDAMFDLGCGIGAPARHLAATFGY